MAVDGGLLEEEQGRRASSLRRMADAVDGKWFRQRLTQGQGRIQMGINSETVQL